MTVHSCPFLPMLIYSICLKCHLTNPSLITPFKVDQTPNNFTSLELGIWWTLKSYFLNECIK